MDRPVYGGANNSKWTHNVYVVVGSAGEYSHHREWMVAAYRKEQDAADHVVLASYEALKLRGWECENCKNDWTYCQCGNKPKNSWDEFMEIDYSGTRYGYSPVSLYLHEPIAMRSDS